ncbi:hypothetical protein ACFQ1S_28155 [Kibdelosporangium lantanae]|uniref:Uncharacterized protein n=1 Tax=Kibdelosporangium lantanae TaxID=1497396 RepID=A0ABW3MIU6_9PSEU
MTRHGHPTPARRVDQLRRAHYRNPRDGDRRTPWGADGPGEELGRHPRRRVRIDGGPESVLTAGDVFYEPESTRIARFDAGEDGVTFLGYFPLGPGETAELTLLDG